MIGAGRMIGVEPVGIIRKSSYYLSIIASTTMVESNPPAPNLLVCEMCEERNIDRQASDWVPCFVCLDADAQTPQVIHLTCMAEDSAGDKYTEAGESCYRSSGRWACTSHARSDIVSDAVLTSEG
jgi:hypothetical protein